MATPLRILLADDNGPLRLMNRLILEGTGRFEVVAEAEDGAGAVEAARRTKPDVVLLDVSMPGMRDLEALAQLEAARTEINPHLQVVLHSAHDAAGLEELALAHGAAGSLPKDGAVDTLADRLLEVLKGGAS